MQSAVRISSAAYRTAIVTGGVFFAAGLTLAALGPSLPTLAARIGVDIAALGGLFTATSVGVIIAQLGVVQASRRFDQRTILAVSVLLMGVGGMAIAQGGALLALLAAALLSGLGFGGIVGTGNTLVAQLFPARSAAALNGVNLFFGIGAMVGPAIAGAANARFNAPQLALWVGAGLMVALAPVVILGAAAQGIGGAASTGGVRVVAPPRSWLFGLMLLVYTGTEIGFGAWLTLYMVSSAGLDLVSAALVVSGFWLALTSGRALAATLGGQLSVHGLLKLCLVILLLGTVLITLSIGNLVITCIGVLLFGLSCGPIFPTVIALVSSSTPGNAATSMVLAMGNSGGLLVPALIGLLLTRYGPPAVAGLLVLAALLMIGLGAAAMRPSPGASNQSPPARLPQG